MSKKGPLATDTFWHWLQTGWIQTGLILLKRLVSDSFTPYLSSSIWGGTLLKQEVGHFNVAILGSHM